MIWLANLDPSTLTLNLDLSTISSNNSNDNSLTLDCIHDCVYGNIEGFKNKFSQIVSVDEKERCARFASVIWHEQRHFLDLILLNYGNYITRQFFTSYTFASSFLGEFQKNGQKKFVAPISLYEDPISRLQYNLNHLPRPLSLVLNDFIEREKAITSERKEKIRGIKEMGGYAQLEALGYIYQVAAIENIIPDYYKPLSIDLDHQDVDGMKYNWFLKFSDFFKFPTEKIEDNKVRKGFLIKNT